MTIKLSLILHFQITFAKVKCDFVDILSLVAFSQNFYRITSYLCIHI